MAPQKELTQIECLNLLEDIIWQNQPICPYCKSRHHTRLINENRYRCNSCHTAYSVTVNTLFHDTRLPLNKWFKAILILEQEKEKISSRDLAQLLDVNKNTAWYVAKRIKEGLSNTNDRQLIISIAERLRG